MKIGINYHQDAEIIISDFEEIKLKIENEDQDYLETLINNIYQGDFYILKNSFSKKFIRFKN